MQPVRFRPLPTACAVLVAAVTAGSAMAIQQTFDLVPDESTLSLNLLLDTLDSRVGGTIDADFNSPSAFGISRAGIAAIDGVLLDEVNITAAINGGEPNFFVTAPPDTITVGAVSFGTVSNPTTFVEGTTVRFDQTGVNVDLAGTINISGELGQFDFDLADVGTIVNQSILGATLSLGFESRRIEAPIALTILVPVDTIFIPISITGTLVGTGAGLIVPPLVGDYNGSGQVEQGDLDLVLQNWGADTAGGSPNGWTNDPPQGLVEQAELDRVLQNWGATGAPDFRGTSVPEPAFAVLGLSLVALRRLGAPRG